MKRVIIFTAFFLIFNIPVSSQDKIVKTEKKDAPVSNTLRNIQSHQAIYGDSLSIKEVYFNKRNDYTGKGEVLEVEFRIKNVIDDPQDLYVFVIATFENEPKKEISFELPTPNWSRIKTFVPYPDDIKNFQYDDPNNKGKTIYSKIPKDPKAGIDSKTGKPYHLTDNLFIRTMHLSKYRNNFYYFNRVTILVYDIKENPVFKQHYRIYGVRR